MENKYHNPNYKTFRGNYDNTQTASNNVNTTITSNFFNSSNNHNNSPNKIVKILKFQPKVAERKKSQIRALLTPKVPSQTKSEFDTTEILRRVKSVKPKSKEILCNKSTIIAFEEKKKYSITNLTLSVDSPSISKPNLRKACITESFKSSDKINSNCSGRRKSGGYQIKSSVFKGQSSNTVNDVAKNSKNYWKMLLNNNSNNNIIPVKIRSTETRKEPDNPKPSVNKCNAHWLNTQSNRNKRIQKELNYRSKSNTNKQVNQISTANKFNITAPNKSNSKNKTVIKRKGNLIKDNQKSLVNRWFITDAKTKKYKITSNETKRTNIFVSKPFSLKRMTMPQSSANTTISNNNINKICTSTSTKNDWIQISLDKNKNEEAKHNAQDSIIDVKSKGTTSRNDIHKECESIRSQLWFPFKSKEINTNDFVDNFISSTQQIEGDACSNFLNYDLGKINSSFVSKSSVLKINSIEHEEQDYQPLLEREIDLTEKANLSKIRTPTSFDSNAWITRDIKLKSKENSIYFRDTNEFDEQETIHEIK